MTIVDVDSHFFEPLDWLQVRFPRLAAELPPVEPHLMIFETILETTFAPHLPDHLRPRDALALLPRASQQQFHAAPPEQRRAMGMALAQSFAGAAGACQAADRVRHLDEQGVACQLVLPTFAMHPILRVLREKPERAPDFISAYNTWAQETLHGHTERVIPVTLVDLHCMDRDAVLSEMRRGRAAGSRSVAFRVTPARGKSLAHPEFDWFWAAAADLGMFAQIHIPAGEPTIDPGWFNNGRPFPSGMLGWWEQAPQVVELLLTELMIAGTFARHENLRVLVSEYGVGWLGSWLRRIDLFADGHPVLGSMEPLGFPLRPSEYARRQIRVSPLPFDRAEDLIEQLDGDILVFCSDYPHPEGGGDAVNLFRKSLEGRVSAEAQARFFGETAAADLALGS